MVDRDDGVVVFREVAVSDERAERVGVNLVSVVVAGCWLAERDTEARAQSAFLDCSLDLLCFELDGALWPHEPFPAAILVLLCAVARPPSGPFVFRCAIDMRAVRELDAEHGPVFPVAGCIDGLHTAERIAHLVAGLQVADAHQTKRCSHLIRERFRFPTAGGAAEEHHLGWMVVGHVLRPGLRGECGQLFEFAEDAFARGRVEVSYGLCEFGFTLKHWLRLLGRSGVARLPRVYRLARCVW